CRSLSCCNDLDTSELYALSLHDALPILAPGPSTLSTAPTGPRCSCCAFTPSGWCCPLRFWCSPALWPRSTTSTTRPPGWTAPPRSEEHTSELQSRFDLVCRLLLENKNYI